MPDLEGKKQEAKLVKPETLIFHATLHQKLRTGGLQALSPLGSEALGLPLRLRGCVLAYFQPLTPHQMR